MLEPAEKKEIIDSFRHEFRTFKDDTFKPIADAVTKTIEKTAQQGEHIASNRGDIKTLKGDVKENRTSIGRLFFWIMGALITIMGTFAVIWFAG